MNLKCKNAPEADRLLKREYRKGWELKEPQNSSSVRGGGFWIAGRQVGYGQEKSPNAKVNVGQIGVAGMRGADHLGQMAGQNQIALCDVDEKNLAQGAAKLRTRRSTTTSARCWRRRSRSTAS